MSKSIYARFRRAFSCLIAVSFLILSSDASALDSLTGCVEDSTNAPISGARVVVRNLATGQSAHARSDESGCFGLEDLQSGNLSVAVLVEAFEAYENEITLDGSIRMPKIVLDVQPIRNSVTVTAQRTAAPTEKLGSSVDLVDRTELEAAQTRNVFDALRNMAGFAVQQTGASGITNFFVRGGESDYNKVLIDGVPVNLPGDTYDFAHIPVDNVDRVEIVRGPQSALFGSDAMSSVVQIFTRGGPASPVVDYTLEGGSFHTLRQAASVRSSFRSLDFSNTFSRSDTDNVAENNDYRNASYFGNFGYTPDPNQSVRLTLMHTSVRAGTPGPTAEGFFSFDPTSWMQRRELAAGLSYDALLGSRVTQHAAYRFHDLDQTFFGAFGPFEVTSTRHRFEYRGDVLLSRGGTFSYGVDFDREHGAEQSRDNFGYYVQQQLEPVRGLHVTAGLRIEDNDSFGTVASPRVGVSYRLWAPDGFFGPGRLRLALGRGIKEPRFLESFSKNPFFLGNPDLEAERSRSWEIGWEQGLANDRVVTDITWFDNTFLNLIQLVPVGDGSSRYRNIGLTTAHGLEIRTRVRTGALRSSANYTYLEGRIEESSAASFPFRTGDPLLRRPKHSGGFRVSWLADRWTAAWNSRFVGRRADSDFFSHFPPLTSNEYHTASNLAVTLDLTPQLSAFVRIDNIFDRTYQEVLGFEALTRGITVGSRIRWGPER